MGIILAIAEGHGDTALVLLKAGAETDKRDEDGHLAIELAPDTKVSPQNIFLTICRYLLFCDPLYVKRAHS